MTDRGAEGGWNHAVCPTCGQEFAWTVVNQPHIIMQCRNYIPDPNNKGKRRCPQKYTRSEWEYLSWRQRKEDAKA